MALYKYLINTIKADSKIKIDFITFLNNLEIVKKEEISQDEPSIGSINKSAIPKKMKRNEPCFCGSGKKYKHCCGAL